MNLDSIECLPKNEISIKIKLNDVDPGGVIIMPVTYGANVKGPFLILMECKEPFLFTKMDEKFN